MTAAAEPGPAADPQGLHLIATLAVLLGFASISTDLYLPAMPAMREALGAGDGAMQLTVSGYLAGFGFGQLVWGPLSDRFGRRGPTLAGIALFALGSAGCALSGSASALIAWRVVQALGASAGVALARAMVRDLYDRERAAKLLSTLMTVMAVAPLVGPSVGAQILALASWRAIFWTLVAVGALTALSVALLPETLAAKDRVSAAPAAVAAGYRDLLRNRTLAGFAAAIGFFYAGLFATIAGTPFAYIAYYGVAPARFGLMFAAGVGGLMAANVVNARLVGRYGVGRMLRAGTLGAAAAGALGFAAAATGTGGLPLLFAAVFLFTAMNGLILANAVAGALASVPARAGAASALIGAVQYGGGMLGSALIGAFADGTPAPMGAVMALAGAGSLLCVMRTRA